MLQFKMGQFAGLANQAIAPGTVYVTTDEQALYVDIPASGEQAAKRIRMGDVIQVKDVAELTSFAPDYSQTALYYVIDKNALMKYTGDGTTHTWKQINSVSDVTANLNELTIKVNNLETTVAGHTTAIGKASAEGQEATGLYKRIEALEAEDVALDGRLDVVEPKVTTLENTLGTKAEGDTSEATVFERLAANATAAANAQSTANTNATDIAALNKTVNEATTGLVDKVAALETADTNMGTRVDGIEDRVEANEAAIGTKAEGDTSTKSLYARVYDNQLAAKSAQDKANANELAISGLNTTIGSAEEGKESGILGNVKQLQADVDAVELALGAKEDAADPAGSAFARIASVANKVGTDADEASATGSLYARVKQNAAEIADAKGDISENAAAIVTVTSTANAADALSQANAALIGTKGDAKEVDTAFGRIAKNAADITALAGRVGTAEGEIDTLQETVKGIATNSADIVKINNKLAGIEDGETVVGKINDLKTELQTEIDKDINAANAMNFKEGIEEYGDLPTTGVKVGDTYVVLNGFDQVIGDESVRFNAGDLLVATGTEDATTGVIGADLAWNHVRTGYVDAHEAHLTGADNAIKLTSHLGADLGSVAFTSSNENLKVAVAGNQVTLGLEWGSF